MIYHSTISNRTIWEQKKNRCIDNISRCFLAILRLKRNQGMRRKVIKFQHTKQFNTTTKSPQTSISISSITVTTHFLHHYPFLAIFQCSLNNPQNQFNLNNKFITAMPKSQHSQSFSVNSSGTRLNQTEKMQKEADHYTKKYQWERRNLLTLQGVESKLHGEIQHLKRTVAQLKKESEEGQVKVMFTKMRNLQKQIDINDKRYNQTMGEISKLKSAINLLRQQKTMYQNNLKSLQNDIEKADGEINSLMQNIESSQNTSKMSQNLMLSLKMKNEEDKTNYYRRLTELNKELKDPKLNRGSRIKTGEINAIQNDTAAVLKHRLTKLIVNNKEKVKLIDNYQRNMKVIDQAFTTIKEATGLTDILEIQNTFIKGQEQNYNLLTYVDVLNQEIDNLVDVNQNLRAKNEQLKKDNEEKQKILNDTPQDEKRRIKIQQYVDKKKKEVDQFQKMLDEISPLVRDVLIKLAGSKFNRTNPHRVQEYINSGVNLNDSNLAEYLSELEEYTNSILIYKGKATKQSNSEIYAKTLLLDQLAPKEFKKKTYDHTVLQNVLEDVRDKTKGIEKLLDREQLEDLAKKDLEAKKQADAAKVKKK